MNFGYFLFLSFQDVFADSTTFDQWFEQQNAYQDKVVEQLHKVLRPFLLRRVKSEVEKALKPKIKTNLYVGMSEIAMVSEDFRKRY